MATAWPVTAGELVDLAWLNAIGARLIWDSTDDGVSLPAIVVTSDAIPSTYTNLLVIWRARSAQAGSSFDRMRTRINGISSANYYANESYAQTTTVACFETGAQSGWDFGYLPQASVGANHIGSGHMFISGYTDPSYWQFEGRAMCSTTTSSGGVIHASGAGWYNGSAGTDITQIEFRTQSGSNIAANSRFSIYGIN